MKSDFVGLGSVIVVALLMGVSLQCEAAEVCEPRISLPSARYCASQQRIQPVAQSVTVTVPVAPPPNPYMPPACGQPPYCPPPAAALPSRSMPVRVDIAVRPEACDRLPPVPVVYRDPGFLAPIISHSVGLIGATIAAPFRVTEMLCPTGVPACPPGRACGPPPCAVNSGYPPPAASRFAPACPQRTTQPVSCRPVMGCAPPGPSVAPLPPCRALTACDANLPPALVEEYQFPQCEPHNLVSGIWNLPGRLFRQGRVTGDIMKPVPGAPGSCR
jgi:hypothetical protein